MTSKQAKKLGFAGVGVLMVIAVLLALVAPMRAALAADDKVLEAAEKHSATLNVITQNCASIKKSLIDLQRADSRTRAYLGSAYERVSNKFITPLNLRLVRNNMVDATLLELQNNFNTKQNEFRNDYTEYMRELEFVVNTDCEAHPETFYDGLTRAREKREKLHKSALKLNEYVNDQQKAVKKLMEKIK